MLQISQPFSFPGPTRMSHRKRNLNELSVLARKSCNKVAIDTNSGLSLFYSGRGINFVFWRDCARKSYAAPRLWTFRPGLVLG